MELLFADRAPCHAGVHIRNSLKKRFYCHMAILPEAATVSPLYFGQPLAGFFFASDFLTASCQFPFSFKRSALGPGVAFFLEWFEFFTAFFLLTILNIHSLRNWVS